MKKYLLSIVLVLAANICWAEDSEFVRLVSTLNHITDIKPMPSNKYPEKYEMKFEHPLDYAHPEKGSFTQRLIVGHVGFDRPTVMVTEGYGVDHDIHENSAEELSILLNCNVIFCEYRYFLESMPQPCNWDYLTVWNSLCDLHEVNQEFHKIYTKKWVSTGISKGGQTTMFYRAYFPEDVDVSVPYVAPLNKAVEDGRHEPFVGKTAGNQLERNAILEFQKEILKRRKAMEPLLKDFCKEKGLTFNKGVEIPEILDMCVLEYAFAIWQWGTSIHDIPDLKASTDKQLFDYLVKTSGPDYFRPDPYFLSFFVQAARELGYYGYDTKPLKGLLSIKNAENYLHRMQIPAELDTIKFNPSLYKHTVKFLKENDPKMIYIYGENDPWSASGVCTWLDFSKKKNMHLYVDPAGSHRARIATLPLTQKEECIRILKEWLE